jgi:hypothetical protein
MQLRQAAALHHARYRGGFHSAASLAAAQAGVKFAIAHNTPALPRPQLKTTDFTISAFRFWCLSVENSVVCGMIVNITNS